MECPYAFVHLRSPEVRANFKDHSAIPLEILSTLSSRVSISTSFVTRKPGNPSHIIMTLSTETIIAIAGVLLSLPPAVLALRGLLKSRKANPPTAIGNFYQIHDACALA